MRISDWSSDVCSSDLIGCDVLVFGGDKAARASVVKLADQAGLRGIHGGALVNSAAAEALPSVLIFINKTYKVDGAGIQSTGKLIDTEIGRESCRDRLCQYV